MLEIQNPIPRIVENANEILQIKGYNDLFTEFRLLPAYGFGQYQSLGFLFTLLDLAQMSPSHNACKNDIVEYAFGDSPIYLDENNEAISDSQKSKTQKKLSELSIDNHTILDLSRQCYHSLSDTGNAFLFIRISKVDNQTSVYFELIPIQNIAYIATKEGEQRKCVITEKWDKQYWKDYPPKIVSVTDSKGFIFLDSNKKKDSFDTVFHMKSSGKWYGKPKVLSGLTDMFTEIRMRDTIGKVSDTMLVAKHILLKQREDVHSFENGSEDLARKEQADADAIRGILTNTGKKAQSMAILHYPNGLEKPSILDLNIVRDFAYNTGTLADSSSFIYSLHGWSKELTGAKSTASGLGANLLLNLFVIKNSSTIVPLQVEFSRYWSRIMQIIDSQVDIGLTDIKIGFKDKVSEVVKKLSELNANNSKSVVNTAKDGTTDTPQSI